MSCGNPAFYYVEKGFNWVERETRCGSTITRGNHVDTAFCTECENDPEVRADHARRLRLAEKDNAWLASAGWGEI